MRISSSIGSYTYVAYLSTVVETTVLCLVLAKIRTNVDRKRFIKIIL